MRSLSTRRWQLGIIWEWGGKEEGTLFLKPIVVLYRIGCQRESIRSRCRFNVRHQCYLPAEDQTKPVIPAEPLVDQQWCSHLRLSIPQLAPGLGLLLRIRPLPELGGRFGDLIQSRLKMEGSTTPKAQLAKWL